MGNREINMLLFMYMIYVIYFISKLEEKEDKRVSLFTKIVVCGFIGLSLIESISA